MGTNRVSQIAWYMSRHQQVWPYNFSGFCSVKATLTSYEELVQIKLSSVVMKMEYERRE